MRLIDIYINVVDNLHRLVADIHYSCILPVLPEAQKANAILPKRIQIFL